MSQEVYEAQLAKLEATDNPDEIDTICRNVSRKLFGEKPDLTNVELSRLKKAAVAKIQKISASYEIWESIFSYMSYVPPDDYKQLIAKKIIETASEFEHWRKMVRRCACFGEYQEHIYHKLVDLAVDEDQLLMAYKLIPKGSDHQAKIIEKVLALTGEFKKWFKAYCKSPEESLLREKLAEQFETMKPTLLDLWRAYRSAACKKYRAGGLLFSRMCETVGGFDDWCRIYIEASEKCPMKQIAKRNMKEQI